MKNMKKLLAILLSVSIVSGNVILGTTRVSASTTVSTNAVTDGKNIYMVIPPSETYTTFGVAPVLPKTTTAYWTGGIKTEEVITWDVIDPSLYNINAEGSFEVNGTINKANVKVTGKVLVKEKLPFAKKVDFNGYASTKYGVQPTLTKTVKVTWSDGTVTDENVKWDLIPTDILTKHEGGSYNLYGTVENISDPTLNRVKMFVSIYAASVVNEEFDKEVTTEFGVQPVLSKQVTLTYEDGVVETKDVTWMTIADRYLNKPEGNRFTIQGFADKHVISTWVNVKAQNMVKEIKEVAKLENITTEFTMAPQLPSTVKVTWTDSTITDEVITWENIDSSKYNVKTGSEFTVNGTINNGKTNVTVTVIQNKEIVKKNITILGYLRDVVVQYGVVPVLPEKMHVYWSDGSQSDEIITWETVDPSLYNLETGNSFKVNGTIDNGKVNVSVKVIQKSLIPVAEKVDFWNYASTTYGVQPTLIKTVKVTWSDGRVTNEEVIWGLIPTDILTRHEGGSYKLTGTVTAIKDSTLSKVLMNVSIYPAKVIKEEFDKEVTTEFGVQPNLSKQVTLTYEDGVVETRDIVWNKIDEKYLNKVEGNKFGITGWAGKHVISALVNVKPQRQISEVSKLAAINTNFGTAPVLPKTVSVKWTTGETTEEAINWSDISPDGYKNINGNIFEVSGTTIEGREVKVKVNQLKATLIEVEEIETLVIKRGEIPSLPETVKLTLNNGEIIEEKVVWEEISKDLYNNIQGNEFTVVGKTLFDTEVKINVIQEKAIIVSIEKFSDVITESGVAPVLPKFARITLEDGVVIEEAIVYEKISKDLYSTKSGNEFTVIGKTLFENDVKIKVFQKPALIEKISELKEIYTLKKQYPILPKTVSVVWSNGETTEESVVFESINKKLYQKAGNSFVVNGVTINGIKLTVRVNVVKENYTYEKLETVMTESGSMPKLPKTIKKKMITGEVIDEKITWNKIKHNRYSSISGGSFIAEGYTESNDKVEVKVIVSPAKLINTSYEACTVNFGFFRITIKYFKVNTYSNGEKIYFYCF